MPVSLQLGSFQKDLEMDLYPFKKYSTKVSLLQKARFAGDFSRREAKAEGAGGHFWHDEALTQTS